MSKFKIKKSFRFEAGHRLENHNGPCFNFHGHSYELSVYLTSNSLQEEGPQKNMVFDYTSIKKIVDPLIKKYFDHKCLNETLETDSPTAEFIAKWIFHQLKPQIPQLSSIGISETDTSEALYEESLIHI